jgi:plasmid stabilization system protein ParE
MVRRRKQLFQTVEALPPAGAPVNRRRPCGHLSSHPIAENRGRRGHRSGTRELVLTPLRYIVVYSVRAETVHILHVHHDAQDWR